MPASWPTASPGSSASWCPARTWPRATSVPRTLRTYSCDARPTSSWMRTDGIDGAELAGDLAADGADAAEQRAARRRVDERDQAEADRRARAGRSAAPRGPGRVRGRRRARAARPLLVGARLAAASCSSVFAHRAADQMNRAPTTRNGSFGRPGTSANAQMTTPATSGALRWLQQLAGDVGAEVWLGRARVTMMPVATEMSSAGICAARPSPIVSSEIVLQRPRRTTAPAA